jgi:hypothetical protein
MKRAGRPWWLFLVLALMLFPACSRQSGPLLQTGNAQTNPLPFDHPSQGDGVSPTQAFTSASVPAGTAIVIRLQSSVSSVNSHAGEAFRAVLDEPIVVQGQTFAASGTAITGRVLAARPSELRESGYLRLTLSSVILNGHPLDVHSSSVFSKGGPREHPRSASIAESPRDPASPNDVRFSTGRRLTFRLIQPLPPQS